MTDGEADVLASRARELVATAFDTFIEEYGSVLPERLLAAWKSLHVSREPELDSLSAVLRHQAMELLMAAAQRAAGKVAPQVPDDSRAGREVQETWQAFAGGHLDEAERRAGELLAAAEERVGQWDHGNLIHHGHLVLGYSKLRRGDVAGAEVELLAAGRTPGSPQLNSFGPNMALARALLRRGRTEAVLGYFDLCRAFWDERFSDLPKWTASVRHDEIPAFGPNLVYGTSGITFDEDASDPGQA